MATQIVTAARQRWENIIHLAAALKTKLLPEQQQEEAPGGDTFFHGLLQVVLWLSFAAFLFASLPHVAYFFATFEPQNQDGSISDYWWFVAYTLAIAIDVTAFLLSVNVAVKMRRATAGKAFLAKIIPALLVFITHWPFILVLVGFSWLVNFEHAKEFHSTMLATAEMVQVNLLFWHGTIGDLNPVIASAFPVLAVAYTGMSDRIGDERKAAQSVQPAAAQAIVSPADIDLALKALAEVQSLREQIAQLQAVNVAEVQPAAQPLQQITENSEALAEQQVDDLLTTGQRRVVGFSYGPEIEALYTRNPEITVPEIVDLVGCSRPIAAKWLARMQPTTEEE